MNAATVCFNCLRVVRLDGGRCPTCRAMLDLAAETGQDEEGRTMREQYREQVRP